MLCGIGTGRNWALRWLIDLWNWPLQCQPRVRHWEALATPVPAKSWTLEGTGHSSASSDKTLDTGVPVVSVTLQVPVWHCLQRGRGLVCSFSDMRMESVR